MKSILQQLQEVTGQPTQEIQKEPTKAPPTSALSTKEDRFKKLEAVAKQLNTQFKTEASLVRLGTKSAVVMPHLPTDIPSLDHGVIGIGGLPKGRIIEIFGPESAGKTTATLEFLAAEQRRGELAAFVDAEHALDPSYAKSLGVNVDELFVSQPDSGEQALETVIALVESRAVSIVVVDSVAALVPQAELDGDMGDSHMGLQARLMSQAMRKLRGICSMNAVTVIFINQIREKIGVMFGCFSYNSRVILEDGTTEKIGKLVNQKSKVNVLSFDHETGNVSTKPIIDWHDNGKTDRFLRIDTTNGLGRSGRSTMAVTPKHMIFTPNGEVTADSLKVGDKVLGLGSITFSDLQFKVAVGSVLGNGNLRPTGKHNVTLRIRHGNKQAEYAKYKALIYGNMLVDAGTASNGSWGFGTAPSNDLFGLYEACYVRGKRRLCPELLDNLSLQGLAIWYMDDGSFGGSYKKWGKGKSYISAKSYSQDELQMLADKLERLGVPRPAVNPKGRLEWYGDASFFLHEKIAPFIHPSMEYKIHPFVRGRFIGVPSAREMYLRPEKMLIETVVTKVEYAKSTRSKKRFDISVADNHTYFVDGIAVHNSPETTTGGRALKFYASLRLDVRRIGGDPGKIMSGGALVGHKMKIKAVKNKVGSPFQETTVDVIYGKGIDRFADTVSYAVKVGAIERSGAWYSFKDERLGQGIDKATDALRDNPELMGSVRNELQRAITAQREADAQ